MQSLSSVDSRDYLISVSLDITVSTVSLTLGPISFTFQEVFDKAPHVDEQSIDIWQKLGWDAPIFVGSASDTRFSLAQLLSRSESASQSTSKRSALSVVLQPFASMTVQGDPISRHFGDVPEDGTEVKKHFALVFNSEPMSVATDRGILQLQQVQFEVTAVGKLEAVPISRQISYASENSAIARFVEYKVSTGGADSWRILSQRADTSAENSKDDPSITAPKSIHS
jgi:hypothetical protein